MNVSPAPTSAPDLAAVKANQQRTWASGDFGVIAARVHLPSELLAEAADLRAGSHVLDVASGTGNAAIAAARSGTHVVGIDYVPALVEKAQRRAAAEGLDIDFGVGDAEDLAFASASFDAALSVFGVMFAPDHGRSAAELLRVVRPGGVIGLACWTPEGFIGQMFRTISGHVPAPAGVRSPLLWGTEGHLVDLFGHAAAEIRSTERTCVFRFTSPEDFVGVFRRWYGPTLKAFEALDERGQVALAADLADLARRFDRSGDGGPIAVPAAYLETVIALARRD